MKKSHSYQPFVADDAPGTHRRHPKRRMEAPSVTGVASVCGLCGQEAVLGYVLMPRQLLRAMGIQPIIARSVAAADLVCALICPDHTMMVTENFCRAMGVTTKMILSLCATDHIRQPMHLVLTAQSRPDGVFMVLVLGTQAATVAVVPSLLIAALRADRIETPPLLHISTPTTNIAIVTSDHFPEAQLRSIGDEFVATRSWPEEAIGTRFDRPIFQTLRLPRPNAGYSPNAPDPAQRSSRAG